MPKSPCKASTPCRKTLVEPVLVRVAAIFWPTLPDLPMPTTTILPRCPSVSTMTLTGRVEIAVKLLPDGFQRRPFNIEHLPRSPQMIHEGRVPAGRRFSI